MANAKTYAQYNAVSFTGRVVAADVRTGRNGEFLAVSMYHTPVDNSDGLEITFTLNGGLLSFVKQDYTLVGRILTVTGHIGNVEATYTDKSGDVRLLQRPRVRLSNADVLPGGLAPAKRDEVKTRPAAGTVVKPAAARQELERRNNDVTPESEYSDNAADAVVAAQAPVDEKPAF